jgi:hypothetical protein
MSKVDWAAHTPEEVWAALMNAPQVAGPWVVGEGGGMDYRCAADGRTVATELWVAPGHGGASWRIPAGSREGADTILRQHGWLLVEVETLVSRILHVCEYGCRTRVEMRAHHRHPDQFAEACMRAWDMCTEEEAQVAIAKYRAEYDAAPEE